MVFLFAEFYILYLRNFIFFICGILYFLSAEKMYHSLYPILLRENPGGEIYLIFTLGHPFDDKLPLVMINDQKVQVTCPLELNK